MPWSRLGSCVGVWHRARLDPACPPVQGQVTIPAVRVGTLAHLTRPELKSGSDPTDETDLPDTDDTAEPGDTGDDGGKEGCEGCASGGTPVGGGWLLLGLVGLVLRSRRRAARARQFRLRSS